MKPTKKTKFCDAFAIITEIIQSYIAVNDTVLNMGILHYFKLKVLKTLKFGELKIFQSKNILKYHAFNKI